MKLNTPHKQKYPMIYTREYLKEVKMCIQGSIPQHLKTIVGQSQSTQKEMIRDFQSRIENSLKENLPMISWEIEHRITQDKIKDTIDIYGNLNEYTIIIELDKPRADQVAKKMLSRIANYLDTPILYIALCYPGTKAMNSLECVKYFKYGRNLIKRIHSESILIGCIIDNNLNIKFYE